jgi:hypothetical protein
MSNFVEETVAQRVQGDDPSRVRALGAAIIIGVAAAVPARDPCGEPAQPPVLSGASLQSGKSHDRQRDHRRLRDG